MQVIKILSAILSLSFSLKTVQAFNPFVGAVRSPSTQPKLILIGGPPGTGKSTFGMEIALSQGILKCISTDTVRAVMRSFVGEDLSPALHRSSYSVAYEDDDPVRSWKETCAVLNGSIESLVDDAIRRKVSLVVEGVHIIPSNKLLKKFEDNGGVAVGVLLRISDPEIHKGVIKRRGFITGNSSAEDKKLQAYDRIRSIQEEMICMAQESGWVQIEQKTEPDPLDIVASKLLGIVDDTMPNDRQNVIFSVANPTSQDVNVPPKVSTTRKSSSNSETKTANDTKSSSSKPVNGISMNRIDKTANDSKEHS